MWNYLKPRKSDAFWTDESDYNNTRVHGGTMRDAVRATQQVKKRYARLDPLGDRWAQTQKMSCLSQLLGQSGFFKGTARTTLHPSILSCHTAAVRTPPPLAAAPRNLNEVIALGSAVFGLNTLSKGHARLRAPLVDGIGHLVRPRGRRGRQRRRG